MSDARGDEQLLTALLGPVRTEVSCEVCFQELDRYVESPWPHSWPQIERK